MYAHALFGLNVHGFQQGFDLFLVGSVLGDHLVLRKERGELLHFRERLCHLLSVFGDGLIGRLDEFLDDGIRRSFRA